ncbi:hypothetical protein HNQ51_002843 [Inhella inkyongensis]|uniref:Hint domain-containing protein n=1 Tax=Inhella inkyongensis TaxID=392593 RepID=A0A840S9R0_9BURK|nr:polymorphic toxin-type HINT domain-containing protein [Inhella inkyongensis]MBB5205524.1 hypothetical protein [Inhella inkyongensis]
MSPTQNDTIESARDDDVTGQRISDGRIIAVEDYARAAEGMLSLDPSGKPFYIGCFAAGTLVHTAEGLQPIEKIRVGTQVLAQPEDGGEQALRRVINKMSTLDQPLMAIQIKIEGEHGADFTTLFATPNHPFWVETAHTEDGKHWLAAECLEPCMGLQLADGRRAEVHAAALIRRTQHEDILFAADARVQQGQVLCLKDGQLQVADAAQVALLGDLRLGEAYRAPVYNFEVEEFHTYYVAEVGVWVHNTGCQADAAINNTLVIADDRASIREGQPHNCFVAGTLVHTKEGLVPIEQIKVGDWVLSYPDDQQPPDRFREPHEYAYKRVLQTYVSANQAVKEFPVQNLASGNVEYFTATLSHPIFVANRGWMTLGEILAGRQRVAVETHRFRNIILGGLFKDKGLATVYNIEVEDFNTYYVGEEGVWVHNCDPHSTRKISDLDGLLDFVQTGNGRIEIFRIDNFKNDNKANLTAYSGKVGEDAMKLGLEMALQREVRTDLINASRNGPDGSVFIEAAESPTGKALWLVPESKASVRNKFTDVATLAPTEKAIKWLYEGSGEAFKPGGDPAPNRYVKGGTHDYTDGQGRINNQILDAAIQREFRKIYDLYRAGKLDIVAFIVDTSLPPAGATGTVSTQLVANPGKSAMVDFQSIGGFVPALTSADVQLVFTAAQQYWFNAGASVAELDRIQVNVGDLSNSEVGRTLGHQITLSANGAGWGWFVDATPTQSEEFAPGAGADSFQALAGSAAAGKLDLLTVLIHEMGHALGLGHSSQADAVMDAVLSPGERHLPGADERAGLQGQGGFVQTNRVYLTQVRARTGQDQPRPAAPLFQQVANPSFTNGSFAGAAGGLPAGWFGSGGVAAQPGQALLSESSGSQTRLSQLFQLSAQDRLLGLALGCDKQWRERLVRTVPRWRRMVGAGGTLPRHALLLRQGSWAIGKRSPQSLPGFDAVIPL